MFHNYRRVSGSKPVVGSSKNIIFGLDTKLIAIDSLLLIPRGRDFTFELHSFVNYTSYTAFVTKLSRSSGWTPFILA